MPQKHEDAGSFPSPESGNGLTTAPEKLQAAGVKPQGVITGMTVALSQSASKTPDESLLSSPAPAGPNEYEELERMLANSGLIEEVQRKMAKLIEALAVRRGIEAERKIFWVMESNGGVSLPRPSIVGRYLQDANMTEKRSHIKVHENEVYSDIHKKSPHHLTDAAKKHLKPPTERKESSAAASYFNKGIKPRIDLLKKNGFVDQDETNIKKFWLTKLGTKLFKGWPWWSSRDDDKEPRLDSEPDV